jgi:hypothetical protein
MGEVTFSEVRGNLNARLSAGEFQLVERPGNSPARQFTTADTIAAEQEILGRVAEGRNQVPPALSRSHAIAFAERNSHLNRAQRGVIEDVLSSPDHVQGIHGYAGTGKTTTLSVVRAALETQGYAVEGFAPTLRAARQLAEAVSIRQRCRDSWPAAPTAKHRERSTSILWMSRAWQAPIKCVNSWHGSSRMTECF